MFVCICNALTTDQIATAIRNGACNAECVHNNLNSTPRCCCCYQQIEEMVQNIPLQNSCGVGILQPASESTDK